MRHVDDGKSVFALQVFNFKPHLLAQVRVETGKRLVKQHDIRIDRKGPGQSHPLFAAAGQIGRALVGHIQQVGRTQGVFGPFVDFIRRKVSNLQRKSDIVIYRQMRPDGKGLKYHAEIALFRWQVIIALGTGKQTIADVYLSFTQILESGNHAQGGGFAAARRAKHREAFTFFNFQVQ